MDKPKQHERETDERKKESHGTEKYGSGPGSTGAGPVRVHSNTPENRTGEINPSAPTESTEGPSTNLANKQADQASKLGTVRGEPAQGDSKSHEGTVKKPFTEKHEVA
jgi:hypothetical protein